MKAIVFNLGNIVVIKYSLQSSCNKIHQSLQRI